MNSVRSHIFENSQVAQILDNELAPLRLLCMSGHSVSALKGLDERGGAQALVLEQYVGRYPFELLQNANDAALQPRNGRHRVRIELTDTALIVANTGAPFGRDELQAICSLGRSSKDPRKTIGYKGLGFKSVNEITDTPQVFSPPHGFTFDEQRARATVEEVLGKPLTKRDRLPVYLFPFPVEPADAGKDRSLVEDLLAGGFVTVVRLPFKRRVRRSDVERHLRAISPQLLLLLDATDELELRGTTSEFAASRRSVAGGPAWSKVALTGTARNEEWLVFRRRLRVPDPAMLADLDAAWQQVNTVGVMAAVPLDAAGCPRAGKALPLHVYFPLEEETTGLPILLHADFVVEFDRRHASRTSEAAALNNWIADELAALLASEVAPTLAAEFPGQGAILNTLAPQGGATGFGQRILSAYNSAMTSVPFVPCRDGRVRAPGQTAVMPDGAPQTPHRDALLAEPIFDTLLIEDEAILPTAVNWLRNPLRATELTVDQVAQNLRDPGPLYSDLWSWLLQWHDSFRSWERSGFAAALGEARCVRTTTGAWVAPRSGVFLPRPLSPGAPAVDVPVETAVLPEIERAVDILRAVGVRDFAWPDILKEHVLPVLTSESATPAARSGMHDILRQYFASGERPDAVIQQQLGNIRVAVRKAGAVGASARFTQSRTVYFGTEWTDSTDMEVVYGPFGEAEFLAEDCPDDKAEREALFEYFWNLRVVAIPRTLPLDQRNLPATLAPLFREWQRTPELESAYDCGKGHSRQMQQLRSGRFPDRMADIIAAGDPTRLRALLRLLAMNWPDREDRAAGRIVCSHSQHRNDTGRPVPSLMRHVLMNTQWLPAQLRGATALRKPTEVWCALPAAMGAGASCVPQLEPELAVDPVVALIKDLGAVDGKKPRANDLATLLRLLRDDFVNDKHRASHGSIIDAGRWAMHQLNRSLDHDPDSHSNPINGSVPLPAVIQGEVILAERPYTVSDPNLKAAWAADVAILEGNGSAALARRLTLPSLDDLAVVEARLKDPRPDLHITVGNRLRSAAPSVALLALHEAPGVESEVLSKLDCLTVAVGGSLTLNSRIGEESRRFADVSSHIQMRAGTDDEPLEATAYFGVPHGDREPDLISFGHQLADYLGFSGLGDAVALLLEADDAGRRRYFKARRIETTRLPEFESVLGAPAKTRTEPKPERETGPDWLAPAQQPLSQPALLENEEPDTDAAYDDESIAATDRGLRRPAGSVPRPRSGLSYPESLAEPVPDADRLPPITPRGLVLRPGTASVSGPRHDSEPRNRRETPTSPADRDRIALNARENGRRGEMFAYEQERERVQTLGMDPGSVVWVSQYDESSDHDLESVDENGGKIYIEVKSTESARLSTPVELTVKEWQAARRHRERYYLYRVLEVATTEPRLLSFHDPFSLVESGVATLEPSRFHLILG